MYQNDNLGHRHEKVSNMSCSYISKEVMSLHSENIDHNVKVSIICVKNFEEVMN